MRKNKKAGIIAVILAVILTSGLMPVKSLAATNSAWDGSTIDVSWYNKTDTTFNISTPSQLMGLAAIVNGIYNSNIVNVIGDKSCIVNNSAGASSSGSNNKSTSSYHYGSDNFSGKTVCLTADLNMGGVYDAESDSWSGPNYMPIGGQYLMAENDSTTKLSASFCGTLDGQGHTVYNINCQRRCSNRNFGDGESVGFIGRLGVHDSDSTTIRPKDPTVKNIAVTGYIYANRSVGGIVGKIGKTSYNNGDKSTGGIIENCANYATVSNTDSKGCGGIVGAGWNGGIVENCYNAGRIKSTYTCPTGGISGSNEIILKNCYNVGMISASKDSYAMAIGTNNGGAPYKSAVINCYYLDGSAPGGGYFGNTPVNDGALTADKMKTADFAKTLGDVFTADTGNINNGYPILAWQKDISAPMLSTYTDVSATAWYAEAVNYVMSKGLFDTVGNNKFGPEQPMTRAMLVTAIYRLNGAPNISESGIFTDIPNNAAYTDAVNWAYKNGIVTGISTDTFGPDTGITREQIATMLLRYANYDGMDTSNSGDTSVFTDNGSVSAWAQKALAWSVGAKLINGMGNGTIAPQETASRAQVAQIVMKLAS